MATKKVATKVVKNVRVTKRDVAAAKASVRQTLARPKPEPVTERDVAAAKAENALRTAQPVAISPLGERSSERAMNDAAQVTVVVNGKMALSAAAVREVKALRQAKRALEGDLAALAAKLGSREAAVIAALDAGLPVELGCPLVAVKEDPAPVRPKWKDEAFTLADRLGLNRGVYEAEVKARVEAEVPPEKRFVKKLVINGDVKAE